MGIFTEKVPAPTIKQQNTLPGTGRIPSPLDNTIPYIYQEDNSSGLPDAGGSNLHPNFLEDTIVEVALARNLRGGDRESGDYTRTITVLSSCKSAPSVEGKSIDIETILPDILENNLGYPVERFTLRATFNDLKNLEGGLSIGQEQAISFRKMEEWEVIKEGGLIGDGIASEEKGLVRLSDKLQGMDWEVVYLKPIPGKGIKTLIVTKEKEKPLVEAPVNPLQNTVSLVDSSYQNKEDSQVESFDYSKLTQQTNITWEVVKNN